MVETINLVKEYHGNKAVNNACVKIEDGNIYGFIGKNGAAAKVSLEKQEAVVGFERNISE